MEQQDYRQASNEVWEAMAPGWERRRDYIWDASRGIGERMLEALDPQQATRCSTSQPGPGRADLRLRPNGS